MIEVFFEAPATSPKIVKRDRNNPSQSSLDRRSRTCYQAGASTTSLPQLSDALPSQPSIPLPPPSNVPLPPRPAAYFSRVSTKPSSTPGASLGLAGRTRDAKTANSDFWGVNSYADLQQPSNIYVHPTRQYESLWPYSTCQSDYLPTPHEIRRRPKDFS